MQTYYKLLLQNIQELVPIKQEDICLIKEAFKPVYLKKKDFYLRKHDRSNYMNFVADSCLEVYSIGENDMEHILKCGIEGFMTNHYSNSFTFEPYEWGLYYKLNQCFFIPTSYFFFNLT
ncbi:cyclic nucleotide-binding domain-containing protein [Marivirga arenosa]|uniref:Uncharacterized protein n=1 Tax=Marivirga arenosa TaxID=3059076 RepID=A0AA49GCH3_9BACT|nr:hypothetical protein [Marivirga sp. BKB1-2]WKK81070.1 hypothetical protein QYS47_01315 [Marivirga sp. BKB1-2]